MTGDTQTILLITADDLFKRTAISNNVDLDLLAPAIYIAQVNEIKRILTIPLYEKIVSDYSGDTLSGNYQTIYTEFVRDMLSFFSAAEYVLTASYKITNGGVNRMVPEFGSSVEIVEVTTISQHYMNLGNAIELAFRDWIKSPENTVPEYTVNCGNNKSSYGMSWFLT